MHGLGNDFVVLDARKEPLELPPARIQKICDRNFGVGCDQLVVLEPSNNADIFARFYNADGSESGACGNATRCVADIIMRAQGAEACSVETGRGVLECARADGDMITVNMGAPVSIDEPEKAFAGYEKAVTVNMGNPHAVFFVNDVEAIDLASIGPQIENNPYFPERTNVEFVQVLEDGCLRQRTWERGAGETLACGSGACAVAVAAIRRELIDGREVEILLNGGSLFIEWRESDNNVTMTGPVAYAFEGELSE